MDIVDLIKSEHEQVITHLDRLLKTSGEKTRQTELERLKEALLPHMEAEEELIYPMLQEQSDTRELGMEAAEQHRAARNVLFDVETLDLDDERWHARIKVCSDLLRAHIQIEEQVLLGAAADTMTDDQRQDLAKQFHSYRKHRKAG